MSNAPSVLWKEYFANDKKKARITIALFSIAKHKVLRQSIKRQENGLFSCLFLAGRHVF